MIELTFHWAWILAIILVVIGLIGFLWLAHEEGDYGVGALFGCFGLIVCVLLALVILGIFVW